MGEQQSSEAHAIALRAMRLVLITDGRGDLARIRQVALAALSGGVTAVQLREPELSARQLVSLCQHLRPAVRAAGAVLLVNDRVDVALAAGADGVHLGQRSFSPEDVRRMAPQLLIGVSAHDAVELDAAAAGADYVSLSPVFATASKPGAQALGPATTDALRRQSSLPVVWLGGINAARAVDLAARYRPFGMAVMSAVFSAADPQSAAAELAAALAARQGGR